MDKMTAAHWLIFLAVLFWIFTSRNSYSVLVQPWFLCLSAAAAAVLVAEVRERVADRARFIADTPPPVTDQQFTFLDLYLGMPLRSVANWGRGTEKDVWTAFVCGGWWDRDRENRRGTASRFNKLTPEAERRLPNGQSDVDENATQCKFYRFKNLFDGWGDHQVSFADGSAAPTFHFIDKGGTFILYRIDWTFDREVNQGAVAIRAYTEKYGAPETEHCVMGIPYSIDAKNIFCYNWQRGTELLAMGRTGLATIVDTPSQVVVASRRRELLEAQRIVIERRQNEQERMKMEKDKKNI